MREQAKNIILVFDAEQRSALAVTRALGVLSDTYVITAGEGENALSACSRYSDEYLQYPSPKNSPVDFIQWLITVVDTYAIKLLMPVTEVSSQLILMHRDQLTDVELPFGEYKQLMAVADKNELMPPKSTWFEPKPRSGMAAYLLE